MAPATKKWSQVIRSAAPVMQNHFPKNWRSDAPKCNPSQEISALTSEQLWWTCLLYCACHAKDILPDPLHMSHACHRFRKCRKTLTFCSLLTRCIIPCACHVKRHLNVQKCSEPVNFFFTFDFELCFSPQRSALFRHHNFQKWSERGVFCAFWLGNVLRATTACTFSSSQLPKVVRTWCVLRVLTWKFASCHNGVHFFDITTSKSGPNMVCFVHFDLDTCFEPQRRAIFHLSSGQLAPSAPVALASLRFDPPEPQIIGNTRCVATFLPFCAPGSSLFWDFLFFDLLSSSLLFSSRLFSSLLFYSLLFSDSSHFCFSSVHIVGSLTSKLTSIMVMISNDTKRHQKILEDTLILSWHVLLSSATSARTHLLGQASCVKSWHGTIRAPEKAWAIDLCLAMAHFRHN